MIAILKDIHDVTEIWSININWEIFYYYSFCKWLYHFANNFTSRWPYDEFILSIHTAGADLHVPRVRKMILHVYWNTRTSYNLPTKLIQEIPYIINIWKLSKFNADISYNFAIAVISWSFEWYRLISKFVFVFINGQGHFGKKFYFIVSTFLDILGTMMATFVPGTSPMSILIGINPVALNCSEKILKNIFSLHIILQHWKATCWRNSFPRKIQMSSSRMANIVADDDLATPGVRAPKVIALT